MVPCHWLEPIQGSETCVGGFNGNEYAEYDDFDEEGIALPSSSGRQASSKIPNPLMKSLEPLHGHAQITSPPSPGEYDGFMLR